MQRNPGRFERDITRNGVRPPSSEKIYEVMNYGALPGGQGELQQQVNLPPILQRGYSGNLANRSPARSDQQAAGRPIQNLYGNLIQGDRSSALGAVGGSNVPGGGFSNNSTRGSLDSIQVVPQKQKFMTNNNSEVMKPPPLEMNIENMQKMRNLELNLMDFKGAVDRRFNELQTEVPGRMTAQLQALQAREQVQVQDMNQKLQQVHENSVRGRDAIKSQVDTIRESTQKMDIKLTQVEFQVVSLTKFQENTTQLIEKLSNAQALGYDGGSGQNRIDVDVQLQFLKDQIVEEKAKREQATQENNRIKQEMAESLRSVEQEMANRLREQRDLQSKVQQQLEDEKVRLFKNGTDRSEDLANQQQNILIQIDRKVEEEVARRTKDVTDAKNHIEIQLMSLVEKLKGDERQNLERERRLMEQVQEGLSTMNEIIKGTKDQNQVQMSHQSAIMGEQIGAQNTTLEELKAHIIARQGIIENELTEQKQRLMQIEDATMKHVKSINSVVESEMNRFEKVLSVVEKHQIESIESINQKLEFSSGGQLKWKAEFEDMNAQKLTDINQAINRVSDLHGKGRADSGEKIESLQQEMKLIENALQAQLIDLKDSMQDGDTNLDDRIQVALSRMQERVKLQIDDNLSGLQDQFNDNIDQIESKFKQNNDVIRSNVERMLKSGLEQMATKFQEEDLLIEGKAQQFTVDSERALTQKINMLFGKFDAIKNEMDNQRFANNDPVENAAQKEPKQDKAQVEEDNSGEREHALKEWVTQQIKDYYQDFEKLLNAKYEELRAMLDAQLVAIQDQGETVKLEEFESEVKQIYDELATCQGKVNDLQSRIDGGDFGPAEGGGMMQPSKSQPDIRQNQLNSDSEIGGKTQNQRQQSAIGNQQKDPENDSQQPTLNRNFSQDQMGFAPNSSVEDSGMDQSAIQQRGITPNIGEGNPIAVSETQSFGGLDESMKNKAEDPSLKKVTEERPTSQQSN